MLYVLLGMAFNFLMKGEQTRLGIEFASETLLRTGVALLRWAQVSAPGWGSVVTVLAILHLNLV
ncbi:hypothetical protein [Novosphingobium sp. MD-1]|uniref:hypothetical protein n=1 Tax=Novosphingobium sp. MD-1 TaxID=1630648 RepID=UPI00061C70E0|nr:hypothetical protein [Novosphingobium sp. MD-1]GAO53486.1 hypothetical protein NMD1_00492 [Novosphingobium sp. MD-1]